MGIRTEKKPGCKISAWYKHKHTKNKSSANKSGRFSRWSRQLIGNWNAQNSQHVYNTNKNPQISFQAGVMLGSFHMGSAYKNISRTHIKLQQNFEQSPHQETEKHVKS